MAPCTQPLPPLAALIGIDWPISIMTSRGKRRRERPLSGAACRIHRRPLGAGWPRCGRVFHTAR